MGNRVTPARLGKLREGEGGDDGFFRGPAVEVRGETFMVVAGRLERNGTVAGVTPLDVLRVEANRGVWTYLETVEVA